MRNKRENVIRSWIRVKRDQIDGSKRVLIKELRDVDKDLDQGVISDYLISKLQANNENDVHPCDNDVERGDDNASTDDGVAETVFDTGDIGEQHLVDLFESRDLKANEHVNEEGDGRQEDVVSPVVNAKVMNISHDVEEEVSCASVGLGNKTKKGWIRELSVKHKLNFIAIQETKMESVSYIDVKAMWVCLDRHLLDHRPILLHEVHVDFGPTPFRNNMVRFKKKLQELKNVIRSWIRVKRDQMDGSKRDLVKELRDVDKDLDQGVVFDYLISKRHEVMRQLQDIKSREAVDFIQKSKVRWAIEGDEISKYFYGIINKKRSQLAIRGVFVDGIWRDDPSSVKEAFFDHYAARFKKSLTHGFKLDFLFPKRLAQDQAEDLERLVTRDKIRRAVWSCGENKSLGPDGFTFEFFRRYWDTVGIDFCEAVEYFFVHGSFAKGCNSSFIALIPKVTNAKLVSDFRPISLIGSVYKVVTKIMTNRLNKKAMFFKVDFAKAYDSVRWDYLLDVLEAFGFGSIWCKWIRGTFAYAKASILVNGSPSNEFYFHWDGLFHGIRLNRSLVLTHLFYADDALFIGEWSEGNLRGIINILKCFFLASGLQINILKSQVMGVGVPRSMVVEAASSIGCSIMQNQFKYLGLQVVECLSRSKAWDGIILKLRSRLSKWKAKTLSIGGRFTLLKSVLGASPLYTMSIFKAPLARLLVR
nr:putative RNA-directed DNA polymerase, eukaryota, reverse transcriptase zinc-binding domain protein [Tanacetum cinerariifolium]